MDKKVIMAIYRKDLKEILSLTTVKYSFIFFPLIFLFILLVVLYFTYINIISTGSVPSGMDRLSMFGYVATNYLIFFGIIPLSLASTISSYSIIGEKTQRTIEPILAAPVDDTDIFLGKLLAPFIPTIVTTYVVLAFYTFFADYLSYRLGGLIFPSMAWYAITLLFIPFSTVLMILLTLMFSSRAMDPRSAQQFSAIILVPLLVVFIFGILVYTLTSFLIIVMSLLVILFDGIMFKVAIKLFDREMIVTRWR